MKLLIVGVDGLDARLVQSMPMPFLQEQLEKQSSLQLEEDLWSRGWAKILSGHSGQNLGAFYARPKLDGTHDMTNKFSFAETKNTTSITPLWELMSGKGLSCGFVNVPGMNPPPSLDGFVVAGAGAGANTVSFSGKVGVPENTYSPSGAREILETNDYILDTRISASGITDIKKLFDILHRMQDARTTSFISLCKQFQVDCGFVAYMATTRIQSLAMSEIEDYISNHSIPRTVTQQRIEELYSNLDLNIRSLVSRLNPAHIIFVSDHGASPRLYNINLNNWLINNSFQETGRKSKSIFKYLIPKLRPFVPSGLRKFLRRNASTTVASLAKPNISWNTTVAFGARYIPGIYINDVDRFDGCISSNEINCRVDRIVNAFNSDIQAISMKLRATPFRKHFANHPLNDLLPDIWIDHPDHVFFEQEGEFIEKNPHYGPVPDLTNISQDMHSGIKGRHPLFILDKKLAELIHDEDILDLTIIYKIVERMLQSI